MDENNDLQLAFELEDGSIINCSVITTFKVMDRSIIVLLPLIDTKDQEILLFEYNECDNDKINIFTIEDDELFNAAIKEFDNLMSDEVI